MSDLRAEYDTWIDSLTYEQLEMIDELSAWKAWQASREAIKIKLPDCAHDPARDAIEKVAAQLNELGISYE